jgi:type I restriction enzyme M protein
MPIKKTELYSSLWKSCDELRGGMDASQYKDYVLVLLFVKYISDKFTNEQFAPIKITNESNFNAMIALKGKDNIGGKINTILGKIQDDNPQLGLSELPDFNSEEKLGVGKEMIDRLTNLVSIFQDDALDFSKNKADGDDILGDAYEFLMRHFATESGKSKGQFYTPAEVSRVLAKVLGIKNATNQTTAYDPTAGSGSLLLKVAFEAETTISLWGQEMDVATASLAKMNMVMHDYATAEIRQGNTIAAPHFFIDDKKIQIKTFDYVVANPPFSNKNWSSGIKTDDGNIIDTYERFKNYGTPPPKNGDYAFLLHIIRSLKSTGKGAVILPHGVLFRGNAEATIRENLIKKGYVKGIIGLPANLFYGTGIPACIIVIDKENASSRKGIFMVDASKGFLKDGNKNRLREQDIHKIVDVFTRMQAIAKYSRMVAFDEIAQNDYNLNIPRYIDSQEVEDKQDIKAHLQGGIPVIDIDAMQNYWEVFSDLRKGLFQPFSSGYVQLKSTEDAIKETIYNHKQFTQFATLCYQTFDKWKTKTIPLLEAINAKTKPKKLIQQISEDILQQYLPLPLMDGYNVYQYLLNYWNSIMQDDTYIIVAEGWQAGNELVYEKDKKGNNDNSKWEGKLIPKALLTKVFFEAEQTHINQLQANRDALIQQMQQLEEEHNVEGGLMEDAINDKDKITTKSVADRLKKIKADKEAKEEIKILTQYIKLADDKTLADKEIKTALQALETKVLEQYKILTPKQIKDVVINNKWIAQLSADIQTELQQISQNLTQRIKTLGSRYNTTLTEHTKAVTDLEKKVTKHLIKMGYNT